MDVSAGMMTLLSMFWCVGFLSGTALWGATLAMARARPHDLAVNTAVTSPWSAG
jgi:hypothetical protein